MKLTLTMKLDSAAFEDGFGGYEIARILREYADSVDSCAVSAEVINDTLRDINGNTVGEVKFNA